MNKVEQISSVANPFSTDTEEDQTGQDNGDYGTVSLGLLLTVHDSGQRMGYLAVMNNTWNS